MNEITYGIRIKIEGVADSSVTDESIGLFEGNLSWTWGEYHHYYDAPAASNILVNDSLPTATEAANIAYGGVLGGTTDIGDIVVPNAGVVSAYLRGDIRLEGKRIIILRGYRKDVATAGAMPVAMGRISGVAVTSAASLTLRQEPYVTEKTPLQGVTISKEMCFGQDVKPVGEVMFPTLGGRLSRWKMHKVPTPADMASLHITHDPTSFYPETSWYINRNADPAFNLFDNEMSQNPATGIVEGRGLLRIRAVSTASYGGLWVNLTLDGRNDVFNFDAINALYTSPVATTRGIALRAVNSWVGKELRVVGGTGQGLSFNVARALWNNTYSELPALGLWLFLPGAKEGDLSAWGIGDNGWTDEGPAPLPGAYGFMGQIGECLVKGPTSKWDRSYYTTNAVGEGSSVLALGQAYDYYLLHGDYGGNGRMLQVKAGDSYKVVIAPEGTSRLINSGEGWMMLALNKGSMASAEWDSQPLEAYLNGNKSYHAGVPEPVLAGHYIARVVEGGVYQGVEFGQENELVENITGSYTYETVAGNTTRISSRISCHIPEFGRDTAFGSSPSILPDVAWDLGETAVFSDDPDHTISLSIDVYAYDSQQVLLGSRHYAWEGIGGTARIDIDAEYMTMSGDERRYLNAIEALDMRDVLAMDLSDRRFGGYIVQARLEAWTVSNYGQPTTITCTAKAPRKFVRTPLDMEEVYAVGPRYGYSGAVNTPASLAQSLMGAVSLAIGPSQDAQESYYSLPCHNMSVTPAEGDSYTSILAGLCQQSLMALVPSKMPPYETDYVEDVLRDVWFADDGQDTPFTVSLTHEDILPDTLVISKPDAGFMCSDFEFSAVMTEYDRDPKILKVNTALAETFPTAVATEKRPLSEEWKVIASGNERGPWVMVLRSSGTLNSYNNLLARLPLGQKVRISSPDAVSAYYGEVTAIAPQMGVDPGSPYQVTYLGLKISGVTIMDPEWAPSFSLTATIETMSQGLTWQSCVTSEGGLTYLTARNMWNMAKDAYTKLGYTKKAPTDVTTLTHPIWGNDSKAIQNWAMATIKWQTRPKTALRFTVPLTEKTHGLRLLEVAEIAVGPYRNTPTKGRIVELRHNLAEGTIEVAALAFLDDKDVLIINEQPPEASSTQYVETAGALELDEGSV